MKEETTGKLESLVLEILKFLRVGRKDHPQNADFDWLDSQQVMTLLNIRPRTLQTYRTKGILPYSYIRGRIYYKRSDITNILNANYR